MTRLSGIASDAMSVARMLFKNTSKIKTLNTAPITIASRTLAIEACTSDA